jgi:hypothetical protein
VLSPREVARKVQQLLRPEGFGVGPVEGLLGAAVEGDAIEPVVTRGGAIECDGGPKEGDGGFSVAGRGCTVIGLDVSFWLERRWCCRETYWKVWLKY